MRENVHYHFRVGSHGPGQGIGILAFTDVFLFNQACFKGLPIHGMILGKLFNSAGINDICPGIADIKNQGLILNHHGTGNGRVRASSRALQGA